MASTFLSLVTLFHKHLQSDHTPVWVCSSQFDITFSEDVKTRTTVQYSTPLRSFGSLVLCCHFSKTLSTRHAKWVKKRAWGGWWLTQKRAEERHFWKSDKPNILPQPEERNHYLAWHACRHTHCHASLMCPSKLCVYLVLYLNKL